MTAPALPNAPDVVLAAQPSGAVVGYEPGKRFIEADLWRLWEGQRFPKAAMVTGDGRLLRVVFRGMAGAGPGPDFREAIMSAPDGLWRGDVELHVRTSDFRRHGHHLDPAYANVALHVVFFHDMAGDTLLHGGGSAPVVALGGPRAGRWLEQPARWAEPCRTAPERLGVDGVGEALDRLGAMRFRQKSAAWRKRLSAGEPLEEALWRGLLEALAYGGDRESFARTAEALPWRELRARLLTLSGHVRVAEATYLLAMTHGILAQAPKRAPRPGNGPQRRLEGAAVLAARFAGKGLAASLIGPLAEPDAAIAELLGALIVPRLVGRPRALEIVANVVLPLAAALCEEPAASGVEALYGRLPQPVRYGAVRHLHAASAGVTASMRRQQGMLYLLRQYCTQGGCGKCPLS